MKKIEVEFTKHPGKFRLAYFPGDRASFEEKQAQEMIKAGVAVPVDNSEGSTLPEDLPGRDILSKAKFTFEDIQKVDDFSQIKGIGKSTAAKLVEYFKTKE